MRRVAVATLVSLALVLGACGDGDDDASRAATTTTTSAGAGAEATTPEGDVALRLTKVGAFDQPVDLKFTRTGAFVIEKAGRVVSLDGDVVLDMADEVSTGGEQGLLGLAFSPDESAMYLYFTDTEGDSRLDVIPMGDTLDLGERTTVFTAAQPYANHNGGGLLFGPDGMLYLGLGDGGAGGDPHGNGQNPDAVLGKILRFDPSAIDEPPERFAVGLRNPWRFSFDRENGDLWIGDVGQDEWEEIDRVPARTEPGVNLGWNLMEGTHRYEGGAGDADLLAPVHEYGHDQGQSVVGGFVYRGSAIPALRGTYLFADTYRGPIRMLREDGGRSVAEETSLEVPGGQPVSFAEDLDGELYVVSLAGGVFRIDPA